MATLYISAMAWVAVTGGVVARSVEAASGFSFFVLFLPYLSSGFVPPETLPPALRAFAEYQPLSPVIETLRALLLGTESGDHGWRAAAWCVGILVLAIPASATLFRRRTKR